MPWWTIWKPSHGDRPEVGRAMRKAGEIAQQFPALLLQQYPTDIGTASLIRHYPPHSFWSISSNEDNHRSVSIATLLRNHSTCLETFYLTGNKILCQNAPFSTISHVIQRFSSYISMFGTFVFPAKYADTSMNFPKRNYYRYYACSYNSVKRPFRSFRQIATT